ncbi:OmpH family outer membrane protein [Oleiagrimonas sp.]|jgi:Skp family chaperone for outer membrane proteins|uniref:OmpH family outer membrane protein n=1 Tax=Oleiagrimonas sp. TaxID=2010330 RepID=UPI002625EA10|nr:OmpH family outer membrane protein [Oleiagrimonas sp.]MDA3914400.1 OmpH family outer membrane protein [Oleiagrimonas sp.]
MFSHRVIVAVVLASLMALPVLPAHAQDSQLGGKPIAGLCMLSRDQVLAQSKVGMATDKRMQQLAEQARSDIQKDREPLDKQIQQFQEQASSLKPADREARQKNLQGRMQALQNKAQVLDKRLRITRAKAMNEIGQKIQPLLDGIYKSHNCGLLLDRDSVLGGNMANDLTTDVIAALDKKVTSISFSLAPMPKQSQNGK